MTQLCMDNPLGGLPDLSNLLTLPPKFPRINIPDLTLLIPTLPQPLLPHINIPNYDMLMTAMELQVSQLMNTVMGMIKPMLNLLGIAIDKFLPKIPYLDITLLDLLAGDPSAIIDHVSQLIKNKVLSLIPGLPDPFFPTIKIPELMSFTAFQAMVRNYMQTVVQLIPNLINQVINKLKLKGVSLPAIPAIPTADEILNMVLAAIPFPNIPNLAAFTAMLGRLQNFSVSDLMALIHIPGFPNLPMLPNPLILTLKVPEIDLYASLNALAAHLSMKFLTIPMDFIMNTLSRYLSFSFPVLCVTIPDLPHITIPNVPPINPPTILV